MNRAAFILFLTILFAGCGLPIRDLNEVLSDRDVIGTWKLTSDSLRLFTRDKFNTDPAHLYTITFRSDGTFTFASVWDSPGDNKYSVMEGLWRLEHDTKGNSNIKRRNALRMELQLTPGHPFVRYFNFDRDKRKQLILWDYYVDPDQYEFIEYTRNA